MLAAAPGALAADHNATLGASSPTYDWAGGPGNNVGVNLRGWGGLAVGTVTGCYDGVADCEEGLFKIEVAGKLVVTANFDDGSTDALDLYLYESNEAGEYDDGSLVEEDHEITDASGTTEASDETVEFDVKPGYYLAQGAQRRSAGQKKSSKKAACKKAKKIKKRKKRAKALKRCAKVKG